MNAQVIYDGAGDVVSVTFPDAENGNQVEAVPGEGQSVLTVDSSTITRPGVSDDDGGIALAIINEHRVDTTTMQLVRK